MKTIAIILALALLVVASTASGQSVADSRGYRRGGSGSGCPTTPEPVSMVGLGIAGLGLLRAKLKKA